LRRQHSKNKSIVTDAYWIECPVSPTIDPTFARLPVIGQQFASEAGRFIGLSPLCLRDRGGKAQSDGQRRPRASLRNFYQMARHKPQPHSGQLAGWWDTIRSWLDSDESSGREAQMPVGHSGPFGPSDLATAMPKRNFPKLIVGGARVTRTRSVGRTGIKTNSPLSIAF
jgi:hypothetical protein